MIALLVVSLMAVQQQTIPQASAEVDRREVAAGDVVTLTIRVETRGSEPVEIADPALTNLDRRGLREQSQVSIQAGETTRITTRQIQLTARDAGEGVVGPVRVRQGDRFAETAPITLRVTARPIDASIALSPRVRTMLANMPPPEGIRTVAVGTIASPAEVMVGAPVDVVVAAWFPRELRLQLRTPPTLTDADLRGAWVYPQPVPTGLAATRFVGGRWYDLYVLHTVVFPFTPGRMTIGRAKVAYSLPITYSFLSRELRHEAESAPVTITVTDQPAAGRPRPFSGLVASNLRMQLEVTPRSVAVGDASTVNLTLSGSGNVALWPEPHIRWPDEVRVYPGDPEVRTQMEEGRIAGSKRFTYLVVPDSAGVHSIRDVSVAYLDLDLRRYGELRAAPVDIVAGEGATAVPARAEPPPLKADAERPLIPPLGWPAVYLLVLLFGAPLAAGAIRARRLLAGLRRRPAPSGPRPLQSLHQEFRATLERLVPSAGLREGDQLADALRAAGIDHVVAAHATRVRDRLRHAVYGPGGTSDPQELSAETQEILRALTGGLPEERNGTAA
ncbi:MAG: BatD family protein [Gemmatimonadetes bacterium]|nr:BatD family protein [Gemmatimonadota bacterium]